MGVDTKNALRVTDARLEACFDDGPPDIGSLWEVCLYFEFDREQTAAGIAAWLGPPQGIAILDCACGSGFPALDLLRMGYDVTCSDGSPTMLRHFRRNALVENVSAKPLQVVWDDLDRTFGDAFDVVMCRGGGSYLYAGTWDRDAPPDRAVLLDSLQRFVACVRPGGRLYVDITRAEDLANLEPQWAHHPALLVGDHVVELAERITADPDGRVRTWHSWLSLDGQTYEFERRSHYLPHEELVSLLEATGLVDIRKELVPGEHYDVYTGRRPS
jgi:SAM-dependent methyltransferase